MGCDQDTDGVHRHEYSTHHSPGHIPAMSCCTCGSATVTGRDSVVVPLLMVHGVMLAVVVSTMNHMRCTKVVRTAWLNKEGSSRYGDAADGIHKLYGTHGISIAGGGQNSLINCTAILVLVVQ